MMLKKITILRRIDILSQIILVAADFSLRFLKNHRLKPAATVIKLIFSTMPVVLQKIVLILLFLILPGISYATKKPLIVVLDWFVNPNHAPLVITKQMGFFHEQGLEVTLISPADASEGEKMVIAGKADIVITYQPALTYKAAQGLPLVRFATLINTPLSCLITLDNNLINNPKDLKTKKIGVSTRNTESIVLATMLKKVGLNFKDITPINVRFNLTQALLSNRIDAFTGGMRNFEPNMIKLAGKKAKVFYPEQYGFPMYDELIFVTNKNKIVTTDAVSSPRGAVRGVQKNPNLINFIKALQQGTNYLIKNPDTCWKIFARLYPELNNQLNHDAWFFTMPYFARNPGRLDQNRYRNLANFMYREKIITKLPKINDYAI